MLALDPNETFEIALDSENDKPEAQRARFRFRFLTLREWRETAVPEDLTDLSAVEIVDMLARCLRANLVDWRRVVGRDGEPIPFDPELIDDVVSLGEAWQLYYASRRASRLEGPAKNVSASPSATSTAKSAGNADPDAAATNPTS